MKKSLILSLGLFAMINAVSINPAQAIDWQKIKQNSITALKVAGVGAGIGLAYYIATRGISMNYESKNALGMTTYKASVHYGPLQWGWNQGPYMVLPVVKKVLNMVLTKDIYSIGKVPTEKIFGGILDKLDMNTLNTCGG